MGGQSTILITLKKKYHLRVQKYRDLASRPKAMDERTKLNNLYIVVNQIK